MIESTFSKFASSLFGNLAVRLTFHEERIIKNKKVSIQDDNYEDVFERCSTPSKRAIVIAREKGASSWLNTPPLRKYAYVLTKAELRV